VDPMDDSELRELHTSVVLEQQTFLRASVSPRLDFIPLPAVMLKVRCQPRARPDPSPPPQSSLYDYKPAAPLLSSLLSVSLLHMSLWPSPSSPLLP
jgi:hypothetical protein